MRRTTLGPMAPTDLNSSLDESMMSMGGRKSLSSSGIGRPSLARSQVAPGTAKKATNSRMSIAPGNTMADRRISLLTRGGAGGAGGARADPRPLNKKEWQHDAAGALTQFLVDNDYQQRIGTKVLQAPTTKDFQAIYVFLVRLLDPMYVVSGKLEDEVMSVLKVLRYPFPPSKTSIQSVAPHTWPTILGALAWMMELLNYEACLKVKDSEEERSPGMLGEPAAAGTAEYFWWYLKQAYTKYLAGEADAEDDGGYLPGALERQVEAAFASQEGAIGAEIAAAFAALSASQAELAELQARESALPRLRSQEADLKADVERLHASLRDVETWRDGLNAKLSSKKAEATAADQALAGARAELTAVEHTVSTQELSPADVARLHSVKNQLRDTRARLESEKSELSREVEALQKGLADRMAGLGARVHDYHDKARALQLIPKGAKYSLGRDFTLRLNDRALERAASTAFGSRGDADVKEASYELLGANMKATVKADIRQLRAHLMDKSKSERSSIMAAEDGISDAQRRKADMLRAKEDAERAVATAEVAVSKETELAEARLAEGAAEIAKVAESRDARRAACVAAEASAKELSAAVLAELSKAIASMQAAQASERQRMTDLICRTMLRVSEHKSSIQAMLTAAAGTVVTARDQQASMEGDRSARIAAPYAPAAAAAHAPAGRYSSVASAATSSAAPATSSRLSATVPAAIPAPMLSLPNVPGFPSVVPSSVLRPVNVNAANATSTATAASVARGLHFGSPTSDRSAPTTATKTFTPAVSTPTRTAGTTL